MRSQLTIESWTSRTRKQHWLGEFVAFRVGEIIGKIKAYEWRFFIIIISCISLLMEIRRVPTQHNQADVLTKRSKGPIGTAILICRAR